MQFKKNEKRARILDISFVKANLAIRYPSFLQCLPQNMRFFKKSTESFLIEIVLNFNESLIKLSILS